MSEYSHYWDVKVKKLAEEVMEKSTADKGMIQHFVGGMIWAVEHDLADGRGTGLGALNGLSLIKGTFSDDEYYRAVHPTTPKEEVRRMKELSKEIGILMSKKMD